jgi:hypothetical protein
MFTKEILLKSVFVCALETIFFINIVKSLIVHETLSLINLKPFDYWRILHSFIKLDPYMPRALITHFREIEVKIVSETAWTTGSPVLSIIKELCNSDKINQEDKALNPYNMFFKRLLGLAADRVNKLCKDLNLDDEVCEKVWTIMKI